MKLEDLLDDDFLKQFNNGPELTIFLEQLHKKAIENIVNLSFSDPFFIALNN